MESNKWTNKKTKQKPTVWWLPKEEWEVIKGKEAKYMWREDDLTLGGGHTLQYTCLLYTSDAADDWLVV